MEAVTRKKQIEERLKQNVGKKGLKVKRMFTKKGGDRYDGIEFERRTSKITNPDGSVVFELRDIEIPASWSQIATDIMAQKYFRKKGVPQLNKKGEVRKDKNGNPILGGETSAKQAINRLAGSWRWWGEEYGYFDSKEDANAFEDEIAYMLMQQMAAPNSPQWFNTGLKWAYGITGSAQGHWYVDPDSEELKQSEDAYTRAQPHACFILSIKDDLVNEGGIFDMVKTEARIFKYGSGSGINFSPIRGNGESLSGGGQSSGLMSFLKIFDAGAGAIKSGGTTRRAAKMVCLNMDHPEIEQFVEWKAIEEQKVAALVAGSHVNYEHLNKIMTSAEQNGIDPKKNPELKKLIMAANKNYVPLNYIKRALMLIENGMKVSEFTIQKYDTDFRSEAYFTVGGQNSNNSVRVTAEFFDALEKDADWNLINRLDGEVSKTVSSTKLWEKVLNSAWQSADPGIQYDTTINEWHTCPVDGRINASNPCSEYMFLDDTACNLASLNLTKFYNDETQVFDVDAFKQATRLFTIVLELSVLSAHLPSKEVAERTYLYRTLGLGYANIGSLLMRQGVAYESEQGYAMTGAITAILGGETYATSAEMAKVIGTFNRYDANKKHMLRVMRNHRRAAYNADKSEYEELTITPMGINHDLIDENLSVAAKESWDYALNLGEQFGYRNAQTTVIAPTGTIGLVMDCDTTGIEPDFAIVKFKKLVGGGYFKIVNQSVGPALKRIGYSDSQISEIEQYIIGHATLVNAPYVNHQTLARKGFTQTELVILENRMENLYSLSMLFTPATFSEDFNRNVLKLNDEQIKDYSFNILKHLGFSQDEIDAAEEFVTGSMTIEGAPYLREEHYAIFDCANKCGKKGKRYIGTMGHLKQMAAAQPFLSGAISKTVNLPEEATLADISEAYVEGWKLMLKANALYRDGSKLSQPLNTSNSDSAYAELFNVNDEEIVEEAVNSQVVQQVIYKEVSAPKRRKLPDERHSITHKFTVGGHEGYITVGLFEDGNPGEVFITMSTAGSFLSGIMDAFAVSLSLSLQYGVPLEALVRKLTNVRFEPSGMTGNKEIPVAKSIVDYLGRWMALKFLDVDTAKLYHNEELVDKSYSQGNNFRIRIPYVNGKGHTEVKATHIEINADGSLTYTEAASLEETVTGSELEKSIEPIQMKLEQSVSSHKQAEEGETMDDKIRRAKTMGFTGDICTTCGSMNVKKNGSCNVCTDCGTTTGCS